MRPSTAVALLAMLICSGTAAETLRLTAESATLVLKVVNPTEVRESLIGSAKGMGGFPTLVTNDALHVKIPPGRLDDFMDATSRAGLVLDKSRAREDVTASVAQLEAQARSKEEILARLRSLIGDSNVAATVKIEQSMTALLTELEQVRGELRVEQERVRYAAVRVSFSFPQRDRLVYVHSPFQWLNDVDLDRFIQEF